MNFTYLTPISSLFDAQFDLLAFHVPCYRSHDHGHDATTVILDCAGARTSTWEWFEWESKQDSKCICLFDSQFKESFLSLIPILSLFDTQFERTCIDRITKNLSQSCGLQSRIHPRATAAALMHLQTSCPPWPMPFKRLLAQPGRSFTVNGLSETCPVESAFVGISDS